MQTTIAVKAPQMFYYARLVEFRQLDIQAATGKNVSLHRLVGYTYLKAVGGQMIGIKILTCEPGRRLIYEVTQAGVTKQIGYQLQPLASQCTAVTYSEQIVTASKPSSWLTRWQTLRHCLTVVKEARQVARSYAALPQLHLSDQVILQMPQRFEEEVG